MTVATIEGIAAEAITTDRITTRVLFAGPEDGVPVLFLHGNHSSATWWEDTMVALPGEYRAIAPDLRGYGGADPSVPIDATGGMADWGEDALVLMDHLGHERFHAVGSSLGGNVVWWLLTHAPHRLVSAIQVCPGSPYGFGGTKDVDGTPCYDDWAGTGAGLIPAPFVEAIRNKDMTTDTPVSPRAVLRARTWAEPPPREDAYVEALLELHLGDDAYPGDSVPSANWPFVAPGAWGPNNAISGKYAEDPAAMIGLDRKPPIVWIRGALDQAVSNHAAADLGTLGPTGIIPGYPGPDVYPPQPMIDQIRRVLDDYRAGGGDAVEEVMDQSGHVPYIDAPEAFNEILHRHLKERNGNPTGGTT